ncbi:MAG TPA: hypothetical protein VGB50_01260 [Flavobacterium sp.]|jgi:hypothetical protein
MKKLLLTVFAAAAFAACSSDDDPDNDTASENNFLPLTTGNYWTYNVTGGGITSRDSLYVEGDTVVDGNNYKQMKTLLPLATGFFSQSLRNNAIRKVNSSLIIHGNAGFNLGGAIPIEINLDDFVIFRENAQANDELSNVDGTIEQEVGGYPLQLNYTLTSRAGETFSSYTVPGGETYTDVKSVQITWNLGVSTTWTLAGFEVDIPIMAPQDVLVSTNYYAKNVGMIYGTTTLSYDLEDFSEADIELPIPPSANETQQEFLDDFQAD